MKFLEEPSLAALTAYLQNRELGDRVLNGRIEAFSCKRAGDDKRLGRALEQHMLSLSKSPTGVGTPPNFGLLSDSFVRRLLIDLIFTMNASFPDYDFSGVTPDHFLKEPSVNLVMNKVNTQLTDIGEVYKVSFLEDLWSSVDDVVALRDCEVYSYSPEEGDPFSDGCLWSFNYFFFNRDVKKILFLHCTAKSKLHMDSDDMGKDSDADDSDADDNGGGNAMEDNSENEFLGDMDMDAPGGDDDSVDQERAGW